MFYLLFCEIEESLAVLTELFETKGYVHACSCFVFELLALIVF